MDKLRSSVAIPFARPDLPTYLQITSGSKLSAIDLWRQNDRQVLPQEMLSVQSSSGWGQEAGHAARGTGSMDSWAGSAAGTLSMVQSRYAVAIEYNFLYNIGCHIHKAHAFIHMYVICIISDY